MIPTGQDSLNTRSTLTVGSKSFAYYSLAKAAEQLGDISRLPFSMKVLLENLLRFEDGVTVTHQDLQAMVDWVKGAAHCARDPVPPGARADAGFHRRPRGRRPGSDARCDEKPRRRPAEDQSAGPRPPGHRPQRDGRRVRHAAVVRQERRAGICPQRRALPVPQMGQRRVRQFPGGAAGHRHLPPGQSRIYLAMRVDLARPEW